MIGRNPWPQAPLVTLSQALIRESQVVSWPMSAAWPRKPM
jgi:hypothetical protein